MPSYTGKSRIHFYQVAALETQLEWVAVGAGWRNRNWDEAKALRIARSITAYPWTDFNAGRMLAWVRNWINQEEGK
jgi:hypothetical protein